MVREPSTTFSWQLPNGRFMTSRIQYDDRGKITHLAMSVRLTDQTEIARLDTAHDELHTHYYGQDGRGPDRRKVICPLPDDARARADLLHDRYDDCYTLMKEAAEGRAP